MKKYFFAAFTLISLKASGLIEINSSGHTVNADKYLIGSGSIDKEKILEEFSKQKPNISTQKIEVNHLLDSKGSEFTLGKVYRHKVEDALKDYSFFMIGNDKTSIDWAIENLDYLKSIKAYGLMAVKASKEEIYMISEKLGLPFLNMSLEGLSEQFKTSHYPFVLHNGWIEQ